MEHIIMSSLVGVGGAVIIRNVSRFFLLSFNNPVGYTVLSLCIISALWFGSFTIWINLACGVGLFAGVVVLFSALSKVYSKHKVFTHISIFTIITALAYMRDFLSTVTWSL